LRIRQYKNEVWDIIDNFVLEFSIYFVLRYSNHRKDSLVVDSSTSRPPICPNVKYEVEVRHIKTVLDNVKNWKVFSDDMELKRFLQTIEEFSNISIDQENEDEEIEN
jgi:hypothetical protein